MNPSEPIRIKEPKTFKEQLDILKQRGLAVNNSQEAIATLPRINYYRLIAYGLTLKDPQQKTPITPGPPLNS